MLTNTLVEDTYNAMEVLLLLCILRMPRTQVLVQGTILRKVNTVVHILALRYMLQSVIHQRSCLLWLLGQLNWRHVRRINRLSG